MKQIASDLIQHARNQSEPPFFLLLDLLQDPQNLGTLLRTAEAVGVHGVIMPSSQAAQVTPAVVNASSGAAEHLLIAQYNLVQAIEKGTHSGMPAFGPRFAELDAWDVVAELRAGQPGVATFFPDAARFVSETALLPSSRAVQPLTSCRPG